LFPTSEIKKFETVHDSSLAENRNVDYLIDKNTYAGLLAQYDNLLRVAGSENWAAGNEMLMQKYPLFKEETQFQYAIDRTQKVQHYSNMIGYNLKFESRQEAHENISGMYE
jgi:hypothetical protein